jgi:hypothetical protein
MRKTAKTLLLVSAIVAAAAIHLSAAGFDLVDKGDTKLTLNTSLAFLLGYEFAGDGLAGSVENASVTFNGDLQKLLKFKLSFDLSVFDDPANIQYLAFLKDAYAQLDFNDFIKLRLGRFKAPFGEEVMKGLDERPYAERTNMSKTLPPGRALGAMASGRKILDLFGYDIGVFHGTEIEIPEGALNEVCTAGKVFLRFNSLDWLDLKVGYNAYYRYFEDVVPNHGLAQGAFLSTELMPVPDCKITISAEYEERMKIRNVANPTPDWARGIISYFACRLFMVEPFALFEYYDGSLNVNDGDDLICVTAGVATYFLKKDLLQVKADYNLEYGICTGLYSQRVSMVVETEY